MRAKPAKLKHVSASSIGLFDRCQTRWYYTYLLGMRGKTTDAMTRGSRVHEQLEKYLKDGTKPEVKTTSGLIAAQGLEHIPSPKKFTKKENKVEASLAEYPVPNLPIPFKGFIDYLVVDTDDGIIEVGDHKTTSGWKWIKTEEELRENTQLVIYARHVLEHYPDATDIRLTHVYYLTRPPHSSRKVTVVVSRQHVYDEFDKVLAAAHKMIEAASNTLDHADKNKADCFAYGKRCTQYDECWHTINHTEKLPMSNKQEDILAFLRGESVPPAPVAAEPEPVVSETEVINEAVTVYIGCKPLYGECKSLIDALAPLMAEVCSDKNVSHIGFVPYAQGWDMLAAKLSAQGLPNGAYYVPSFSNVAQRLSDTLVTVANQVVIAG
jgi:RecB family exonuclease